MRAEERARKLTEYAMEHPRAERMNSYWSVDVQNRITQALRAHGAERERAGMERVAKEATEWANSRKEPYGGAALRNFAEHIRALKPEEES